MSDSLGINDDIVLLAPSAVVDDPVDERLFISVIPFRKKDILSAVGNAAPQRKITRVPSHHFNDTAPLMGSGGVTDLVNGLHGRVDSRVKTNGVIRTCNVQVNGSRKSDCIDPKGGKLASAAEGTIRKKYAESLEANSVHGSDAPETAAYEMAYFFNALEIVG